MDLETLAAIGAGALPDLGAVAEGASRAPLQLRAAARDHWLVLTGCRKGIVPAALVGARPGPGHRRAAPPAVACSVGPTWWSSCGTTATRSTRPATTPCVALADRAGAEIVATNNVHYHHPARRPLATALAAVRARRSLDDIDGWLPAAAAAHLRSGAEQARRFARYPGVVERAAELGPGLRLRPGPGGAQPAALAHPRGHTEMSWLRHLTEEGGVRPLRARATRPAIPGPGPRSTTSWA